MSHVRVFGTAACPFCIRARRLLEARQISYQDIRVDADPERRVEMERLSARHTVPQIFAAELHIGGYDELAALERAGRLGPLLIEAARKA